jgi:glycosyltransferase involved in cell wall biosynthesis
VRIGNSFVRLIMTHGYMLSGTGSNVYVQNLCRALAREGHDVHLLCQEREALSYGFVAEHYVVDGEHIERRGVRETPYAGRCAVYNPEIGDLLPVYVYDEYPGWRVKTFLDLTDEELESYLARNVEAVRAVIEASSAEAVVTNHSVPGPLISRRALEGSGVPYVSIVHGSCLHYVSRKSEKYMRLTREGLEGARRMLALSSHSAGTIAEDFPDLEDRTTALPGGVDTKLFRPDALNPDYLRELSGTLGRGPEQEEALLEALESSENAGELVGPLREISASYDARSPDRDFGERVGASLAVNGGSPLILYVGKLIHSKGVHSLLSAFVRARRHTNARLLVIGFGTFREGLQALTRSLSAGDRRLVEGIAETGRLLEGGPAGPLEHFGLSEALLRDAAGMEDGVEFVGPLGHDQLARLLPAADVGVVPSIFPETFGLVAAEFAASGVVPFVADHSGLGEAGAIIGRGLPFEVRVSMDGFEENLARTLTEYLELPDEERRRCEEVVRRNCIEHLGWGTLAQRIVELVSDREIRPWK